MILNYENLVTKYGIPKGIVHIGSHIAQERNSYLASGVKDIVWIDGNQEVVDYIKHYDNGDTERVLCYMLSDDWSKEKFYVTDNQQSSSILALQEHLLEHPDVHVVEIRDVECCAFYVVVDVEKLDMSRYNFLNLDVQGAELKVLRGMEYYLTGFDFIYTEVNAKPLYTGCALLVEMDQFMYEHGFKRVEVEMTRHGWGDAFYIRK